MIDLKMKVPLTIDVVEDIIFCLLANDREKHISREDIFRKFQACVETGVIPHQSKMGLIMFIDGHSEDSFDLEDKAKAIRRELFSDGYKLDQAIDMDELNAQK